jgi:hypothetical protein
MEYSQYNNSPPTTLIKSFFVLTYSLFFFPADCSKEEHWDERYYVEKVPYYGRVVRPCPPGTVFSKSYCDCESGIKMQSNPINLN